LREQNTQLAAIYADELNLGDEEGRWAAKDVISLDTCQSISLIRAHGQQFPALALSWKYPHLYTQAELQGRSPVAEQQAHDEDDEESGRQQGNNG